nr:ECF transporter S component [Agromyces seonyuensis]
MSCAAIGVAGGLVEAGSGYLALVMAAVVPWLYGVTIGLHFLPSVVALALLRRPWVAIITGVVAGLIASAFAPMWIGRFVGTGLLIGALVELPFLLTRYRNWKPWLFYASAAVAGLILAIAVFIGLGAEHYPPAVWAIALPLYIASPVFFTWIGLLVANALRRAGVARGA